MASKKESIPDKRHLKRFYYTIDQAIEKPFNWKRDMAFACIFKTIHENILTRCNYRYDCIHGYSLSNPYLN